MSAGDAPSVSGNLVSLSIEQDRWLDWSGNATQNSFFFNCLDNIVALTGASPKLRIGADSEDHTTFNPSMPFVQQVFPPPTTTTPYPEALNIVAGPGFYEGAQFLPTGTGITWGGNLTMVSPQTKAIIAAFASPALKNAGITLDLLELGNEADLYGHHGLRPKNYTISQYTAEWITFATSMVEAANLAGSGTRIWAGAFANSAHTTTGFSPQGIFANGILNSEPGKFITTISQHHYSGSFCSGNGGLLQDLMTKATIRSNLTSFAPDIEATQAQGLEYVLGETNSYACKRAVETGAPGVSNTAGAALWTLDYSLFASQIGISRLFFHGGVGYKYNLIQPATLSRSPLNGSTMAPPMPPHVQPQYYAAIVAAEAIGNSNETQALEININDTTISGYAFYESGDLKRALFINSLAFFAGEPTNRTTTHLDLAFNGTGANPTAFSVKRLEIGYADDTSGLQWGGQTYETSDARIGGTATSETGTVAAGIDIPATQAILITFNSTSFDNVKSNFALTITADFLYQNLIILLLVQVGFRGVQFLV
ncbi:glycoside hydrolase family 79 protein [Mycena galopus ATCC 62051]|nr:glycoside hydrolase family 79 protein [Mycena galopus ATCC 62051]